MFNGCLPFPEFHKGVLILYFVFLIGISRGFQGCFNGVLRVYQECVKVSRFIKNVSRVFQECSKVVSRVFKGV